MTVYGPSRFLEINFSVTNAIDCNIVTVNVTNSKDYTFKLFAGQTYSVTNAYGSVTVVKN